MMKTLRDDQVTQSHLVPCDVRARGVRGPWRSHCVFTELLGAARKPCRNWKRCQTEEQGHKDPEGQGYRTIPGMPWLRWGEWHEEVSDLAGAGA